MTVILPLHFYIATAKINIEGSLSFTATHSKWDLTGLKLLSKLNLSSSFLAHIGSNNSLPNLTDRAASRLLANSPYSNPIQSIPAGEEAI